jgi:SEC-C motif-containing protein
VYGECCGPIHAGDLVAPTAERLMRSRFSAFAVGDTAYLLASWHPSTRPSALELDAGIRWYRLDIVDRTAGGPLDAEGIVEFVAYFKPLPGDTGGAVAAGSQHEISRFVREGGRWYYVSEA